MLRFTYLIVAVLSVLAAVSAQAQTPLDSAFTYQGELTSSGTPATGTFDVRFRLYDAAANGSQIGLTLCSDNLAVTGGRFSVSLDFGAAFDGQKRFLEIEVRQDTGLDCSVETGYTVLTSRQELAAAPNASFALTAGSAATAQTANNAQSFNGQPASFYTSAANLTGTLGATHIPDLDASKVVTGTIADARLSPNVALLSNPGASQFAGAVGIGVAPTGGARLQVGGYDPAVVDQSQLDSNGTTGSNDQWQSFTAALTGQLTGVRLRVGSPLHPSSSPGTIRIYAGQGTAGQLMATQQVTYAAVLNQLQQFDFNTRPNVTTGSVYTIRFSAPTVNVPWARVSVANPYAGGRHSDDATYDAVFETLVALPLPAFTVSVSGVSIGGAAPPPASNGLSVSGASVFAAGVSAASFSGSGAGLTNINASNITAGTLATAQIPNVDASKITTGTLSTAQVPNLDASKITTGTLADARLSSNIALKNAANAFTSTGLTSFAGTVGIGRLTLATQYALQAVSLGDTQIALTGGPATGGAFPPRTWAIQSSRVDSISPNGERIAGSLQIIDRTVGVSRLLIDIDGNVGIGTTITATTQRLTVAGNMNVTGSLSKGGGSFKIDHPLDPENKYLYHSFVESPDMMNMYNGNVTTDADGYAIITLPDYFEALNRDYRYQLTVIDESNDMDVFLWAKVVRKIGGNQFSIRSSRGNLEVSWQVTGIRKDAWAEKNRIPNSVDKVGREKGKYLHPEAFDKPASQSIYSSPAPVSQSGSK